ncbi:MAG: hypothetical protein ACRCYR_15265 [Phycicoccus sp.]
MEVALGGGAGPVIATRRLLGAIRLAVGGSEDAPRDPVGTTRSRPVDPAAARARPGR